MKKLFFKAAVIAMLALLSFLLFSACAGGENKPDAAEPTIHPEDEWTGSIWLEDTGDYLVIHSPYGDEKLRYLYITEIVYTRQWDDPGELIDGIDNDRVMSGIFESEGETYHLHAYKGYNQFLAVTCNTQLYVFNLEDSEEFFEWKDFLNENSFNWYDTE